MIYEPPIIPNSATTIVPKCGSVIGGAELTISMEIDPIVAQSLFLLTVGFQPMRRRGNIQASKRDLMQSSITKNQSADETLNDETAEGKPKTLNASQYSSVKGKFISKPFDTFFGSFRFHKF